MISAVVTMIMLFANGSVSADAPSDPIQITEQKQESQTFHCRWPQAVGLPNEATQKKVNRQIHDAAFALYRKSEKDIKEGKKAENPENKKYVEWRKAFPRFEWRYDVESTVTYNKNGILSLVFDQSFSSNMQAHPVNAVRAITFDLSNGKTVKLKNWFQPKSAYESRLNSLMKNVLQANKDETPLLIHSLDDFKGIETKQEYYLTDKELVIFYQRYRYTPGAAGPLVIPIAYDHFTDILRVKL
jgi:hypothetical protein